MFSKSTIKDKTSVFTLGDRIQVLTDPDPGIIIPQVAEDRNMVILKESFCRNFPLKQHLKAYLGF